MLVSAVSKILVMMTVILATGGDSHENGDGHKHGVSVLIC